MKTYGIMIKKSVNRCFENMGSLKLLILVKSFFSTKIKSAYDKPNNIRFQLGPCQNPIKPNTKNKLKTHLK
jgi:hypothetical protein